MSNEVKKKHGAGVFVLAGISFFPLLGVLPGVICILIAIVGRRNNSKLLGGLGIAGILVTIILYGFILPTAVKSTDFSKSFEPHAISDMTSLIRHIEYYKLQHGYYPVSIEDIRSNLKEGEKVITFDVSGTMEFGKEPREFHYQVIGKGDHYLLFGIGVDATPFTGDDIYPIVDPEKDKNIGWVKFYSASNVDANY